MRKFVKMCYTIVVGFEGGGGVKCVMNDERKCYTKEI